MDLFESPEDRVNDLVRDTYVAAATARAGKLNTGAAEDVALRLRMTAMDMVVPSDSRLLTRTASALERLSTKIKANDRMRSKAASARPAPRPQLNIAELIRADDAEKMAAGSPFSRTDFEDTEARRVEEANRQLAVLNERIEGERRTQVTPEPERPFWRR